MAVNKNVLGMNARNYLYIRRYNPPRAKRLADDKLATKQLLLRHNISTPKLLAKFLERSSIFNFDWSLLPAEGFVIKPARGYGGGGILPFKKWSGDHGVTISGEEYTIKQLESHILDIQEGAYSLQYLPDKAYIEERINPHQFFRKLAPIGLPDIRFIVFNHIPVMTMIRLPNKESGGKANLHAGAIALGIDIRTGITTYGVYKNRNIAFLPDSKIKVRGIKIPEWHSLLLLASHTQAITGLGYAGIDVVIDAKMGPMVLEVNARPGLSIQIANKASIRERLERVENMPIPTPERGVEMAKSLFAEEFSEKVNISPKILNVIENVTIDYNDKTKTVKAKLDTGAYRTSIDKKLAEEMHLPKLKNKLLVKAASGQQLRETVKCSMSLAGKKINSIATITDRTHLQFPMIVGRKDLKGFLINPIYGLEPGDALDELDKNEEEAKD